MVLSLKYIFKSKGKTFFKHRTKLASVANFKLRLLGALSRNNVIRQVCMKEYFLKEKKDKNRIK